ncbi:MAG: T9SS type A sorting domain-containing protein [Chitinophagales bacterium]
MAFEGLSIYPNPTNDMVNIKVNEALSSIQLYDITGKVVNI